MHIHILGICGTFMGGVAALARELGHTVTGQDRAAWPPMSTQLENLGIAIHSGYEAEPLQQNPPDLVIVGNAVTRGLPALEYVLDRGMRYISGPQWLAENVLAGRWVIAIAGTHGKTTTSSLVAHILTDCGFEPGYLIGGVPANFGRSASLGKHPFFVIEADEYDTAFNDKRSKFVHYQPRTLVLNNLEFDHADIFADLAAIETQFHHLVRTIPSIGLIIYPQEESALQRVLERGCWTPTLATGTEQAQVHIATEPKSHLHFDIDDSKFTVEWPMRGRHNAQNALAAVLAARHAGVAAKDAIAALPRFQGVARRQTLRADVNNIRVYDDFAHHPTAIRETIEALKPTSGRLLVGLELRSNSMRAGAHAAALPHALERADEVHLFNPPELAFDAPKALASVGSRLQSHATTDAVQSALLEHAQPGDVIVLMSNGAFGGLPQSLGAKLEQRQK